MAVSGSAAGRNGLLAVLRPDDFERLSPHLTEIPMRLGETLYEPGTKSDRVCFPATAIVSMMCVLESGACAEVAAIGNEGMVGVSLLLGGQSTVGFAIVRASGIGYRIDAGILRQLFSESIAFRRLVLRYTQALMTQIMQTAVCNRGHSAEQQLCRWLLATLDRGASSELVMTQELVAGALGVRRESISEVAGRLQRAHLILYRRGHISVLNRAALETRSCECYAVVKREVARLLGDLRLR
jgi:CRP-like cAMP-binding protein